MTATSFLTKYEPMEFRYVREGISAKEWEQAATLPLPPYPQELREFLAGECVIWPEKRRSETHLVIPLFPRAVIDGFSTSLNLEALWKIQTSTGRPSCRHVLTWNVLPAGEEFHWAVMTNDLIPKSRNQPYEELQRLLPPGYEVPKVLNAVTALFWENQRSGRFFFSNTPLTEIAHIVCQETLREEHVTVGAFALDGLSISTFGPPCRFFGVAGWRTF